MKCSFGLVHKYGLQNKDKKIKYYFLRNGELFFNDGKQIKKINGENSSLFAFENFSTFIIEDFPAEYKYTFSEMKKEDLLKISKNEYIPQSIISTKKGGDINQHYSFYLEHEKMYIEHLKIEQDEYFSYHVLNKDHLQNVLNFLDLELYDDYLDAVEYLDQKYSQN